jgi:hypothetical protein
VIAIVDPRQADAVVVDEGHAPVVAVLPVFAEEEPCDGHAGRITAAQHRS